MVEMAFKVNPDTTFLQELFFDKGGKSALR